MDRKSLAKCVVEEGERFAASFKQLTSYPADDVLMRVRDFIEFKEAHGAMIPFENYGKDKSSSVNGRGVPIRVYRVNNIHHCHLGLSPSGDPLIMYEVISGSALKLICLTTHKLAFDNRLNHIQNYKEDFLKR